jgi:transposase
MKPYSLDLRQRILAAVDEGTSSRPQIAKLFCVSASWVRRLVQRRRETGSIEPLAHHGGPKPKLDQGHLEHLRALVREKPDATLAELRGRLGSPASVMTICRALKRLELPLKKSPSGLPSRTARTSRGSAPSTAQPSCTWNRTG